MFQTVTEALLGTLPSHGAKAQSAGPRGQVVHWWGPMGHMGPMVVRNPPYEIIIVI
jgi:hypothetical protein